jgi:hypothetical protein
MRDALLPSDNKTMLAPHQKKQEGATTWPQSCEGWFCTPVPSPTSFSSCTQSYVQNVSNQVQEGHDDYDQAGGKIILCRPWPTEARGQGETMPPPPN